jgi:hypothetical protein
VEYAELHFIPITVKKSKQVYPKFKTHTYLNATLDSKKWKESIHPLYEERLQARHKNRRPIWRGERPETQHNFANPGKKKKQDYNSTVIGIDKTVDKAQQAQFHL